QGDHDAGDDQPDADELVLAPADGAAQLVGGGLAAAGRRRRGVARHGAASSAAPLTTRRGATRLVGATGATRRTRRRRGRRRGTAVASRLLLRWAPGGHDRINGTKGVSRRSAIP